MKQFRESLRLCSVMRSVCWPAGFLRIIILPAALLLLGVLFCTNQVCAADRVFVGTDDGLSISTDGGNTFVNRTEADGLGGNLVKDLHVVGSTIYAATYGGVSISTDGGNTFVNKTSADGLGDVSIRGIYATDSMVCAATHGGLSISTDGGNTFVNKTMTDGLGDYYVNDVFVVGSTIYAATSNGLSISTDGGNTFVNRIEDDGLGRNTTYAVYAVGSTVYAGTQGGLSISTDGGNTFIRNEGINRSVIVRDVAVAGSTLYVGTILDLAISTDGGNTFISKTEADGLGGGNVNTVRVVGSTIYAATTDGLSVSTDGGETFVNKTEADGLGDDETYSVYAEPGLAEPTDLTATPVSGKQIDLTWTDNSDNETGFSIFRDGTLIHTTDADVATYSDTGLSCDTAYSYEVKPTDVFGDYGGITADATTSVCVPATLSEFTVSTLSDSILLRWETIDDAGSQGFHILRRDSADGEYARITSSLIPAEGSSDGAGYFWLDTAPGDSAEVSYKVEAVDPSNTDIYLDPTASRSLAEVVEEKVTLSDVIRRLRILAGVQ